MTKTIEHIKEIFNHAGLLATQIPGYETRPAQLEMAEAVYHALATVNKSQVLAVEAETGIGKTLAYLVPAVMCNKKIIVSTGTLNLQEQILTREIPLIKRLIDPGLSALCVKGRQNYLCLYRFKHFTSGPQGRLFSDIREIEDLREWVKITDTGDRAELEWLPDESGLWQEINSTANYCLGSSCPDWSSCFLNQLRKKAAHSRVLIVNHHLFFSDLALRRHGYAEVLPRYEAVIFDEAHHVEDIATKYFGISFSHYQILDLTRHIEKLCRCAPANGETKLLNLANRTAKQAEHFLSLFPADENRFSLLKVIEAIPQWQSEIEAVSDSLAALGRRLEAAARTNDVWSNLQRRTEDMVNNLQKITGLDNNSYVYWVERRRKTVSLSASPIEIAAELKEHLFSKTKHVIFTSATLTAGGNFNYFSNRHGLPEDAVTLVLPSPFDYAGRTLLFIPDSPFPEPGQPGFQQQLQETIHEIITTSNGRALLLFTSVRGMRTVYSYLSSRITNPIMLQGEAPKNTLLEKFQSDTHSVLLAVASFWEGIDVPGESLSCVIIDKLPFEVPSDPVIMARINKIKDNHGNPFSDFQVPRAILRLRQGIGRLLRSSSDKGLVAVMDVRLFTKNYGRLFMQSLPASPVTRNMSEVKEFINTQMTGT